GLMAPAGTPRDVIDKLGRAAREAVAANEVVMTWRPQGIDPLSGGPEEFARHIEMESRRWGGGAQAAGLKNWRGLTYGRPKAIRFIVSATFARLPPRPRHPR